jgi:DNA modification methylase
MAVEAVNKLLEKYKKEIEKSNDVVITSEKYYNSEMGEERGRICIDYRIGFHEGEKKDESKKEESGKRYVR